MPSSHPFLPSRGRGGGVQLPPGSGGNSGGGRSIFLRQSATPPASGTSLGFTAVAGRCIVAVCSIRDWLTTWVPANGFSVLAKFDNNPSNYAPTYIFGKIASGGETSIGGTISPASARFVAAAEFEGATLSGYIDGGFATGIGGSVAAPAVTPNAGQACVVIGGINSWNPPYTDGGGGFSWIGGSGYSTDWPNPLMSWRIINNPNTSYQPTGSGGSNWSACSVVLYAG